MGADDGGHATIEIPAHRKLFRRGLGVHIDENNFRLDIFQQLVDDTERIIIRGHEDAALKIDHGVGNVLLPALIHAPAGKSDA